MSRNLLTVDTLVSDIVYDLQHFPDHKKEEMRKLMEDIFDGEVAAADATKHTFDRSRLTMPAGSSPEDFNRKVQLYNEMQQRMYSIVEGVPHSISPGGSALNTITTMGKMLDSEKFAGTFIGVLGTGELSKRISHTLNEANVLVVPPPKSLGQDLDGSYPRMNVSYVINDPEIGDKRLVGFAGNAAAYLMQSKVTEILGSLAVKDVDTLLLPASIYRKFDAQVPEIMLSWAEENNKDIWFTLPTSHKNAFQHAERFKDIIENHAEVVLGNEEEACQLYGVKNLQEAIDAIQQGFRRREESGKKNPSAFITKGGEGAVVITADDVKHIDPVYVAKSEIRSTVGAGDTAFGGFLAGHVLGLPPEKSAHIGMVLASEKVTHAQAQLESPQAAIQQRMISVMDDLQALMGALQSVQPHLAEVADKHQASELMLDY